MTIDQAITTFNACMWLAFIGAIIWSHNKSKRMKVYDLLIIETQCKMLDLQRSVDNRHVLIYQCERGEGIDQEKWDEHTAEIIANQFQFDESIAALRNQLTKL